MATSTHQRLSQMRAIPKSSLTRHDLVNLHSLHPTLHLLCAGTQLTAASPYNVVRHSCDSTHGQSGSPMYTPDQQVRVVLTGGNGRGLNWGTQVSYCAVQLSLS